MEWVGGAGGAPVPLRFCPEMPAILMTYCGGCNLEDYLESTPEKIDLKYFLTLARRVIGRLHEIHQKGVVHCDLKVDNIMVSINRAGLLEDIHIIDFSCACFVGQSQPVKYEKTSAP